MEENRAELGRSKGGLRIMERRRGKRGPFARRERVAFGILLKSYSGVLLI